MQGQEFLDCYRRENKGRNTWVIKFEISERFLFLFKVPCFIGASKFDTFKNQFAMITSLLELGSGYRRFILLVQTKDFYKLWQQQEQSKIMEMNET